MLMGGTNIVSLQPIHLLHQTTTIGSYYEYHYFWSKRIIN
jgi:hypothetical protein